MKAFMDNALFYAGVGVLLIAGAVFVGSIVFVAALTAQGCQP